ncbi:Crp/Fnr family transcriptional regulator [Flammeovirga pectinis]|uniref:Crp/Fnr family transcriptional regulator n=1 Tax=Flammeovirga pectinis TaxID=2494373 RepID=A0A3S9P6F7_9BACT|nr:Crp/Fnr family transcriptional regulator [Flammeovirga pectinis]
MKTNHQKILSLEELIEKIKNSISLSAEAEKYLYSIIKKKTVLKGDILIHQGQVVKHTYFVIDGCLRAYCIDKNGKEHTLQFAVKDWWISDFIAIYNNELATLTVECIKEATCLEFKTKDLDGIYALFPEFEAFQRRNLERHVVSLHKRILNQLQLTAAERYNLFLLQYPDIEHFTPNYYIASYLGITQQSLSRIRAEKVQK